MTMFKMTTSSQDMGGNYRNPGSPRRGPAGRERLRTARSSPDIHTTRRDPMKCPTDGATLVMSERSGIEIDYCPDCRGVWVHRGGPRKAHERAASLQGGAS